METPLKLSNYANMLITSILSIIIGKHSYFSKLACLKLWSLQIRKPITTRHIHDRKKQIHAQIKTQRPIWIQIKQILSPNYGKSRKQTIYSIPTTPL